MTHEQILEAFEEEKKKHLIISVVIDIIGMTSTSFLGEVTDIIYAPLSGIAIFAMYRLRVFSAAFGGIVGFTEEILPKTDIIPTASVMWVYHYYLRREDTLKKFTKRKLNEIIIVGREFDPNYRPKPNFLKWGIITGLLILGGMYFFNPSLFTMRSDKTAWVEEGLKGDVKFYISMNYLPEKAFGEWVVQKGVDGKSKPTNTTVVNFDKQGRRELLFVTGADKKTGFKMKSEYEDEDDFYLETKRTVYIENQITELMKYYRGENDTLKIDKYSADGNLTSKGYEVRTIEEDSLKVTKIVSAVQGSDGKFNYLSTSELFYNEEGERVLEEHRVNDPAQKEPITTVYKYECKKYDDTGNCLKRLVYTKDKQDKPDRIELRSFEYY